MPESRCGSLLPCASSQRDQLLGVGRALLELDPGVDVLGRLADDHEVDVVVAGADARVGLARPHLRVEVEALAQPDVDRAEAVADRRRDRPLSATPFRRIDSSVESGSGLPPCSSITSAPAGWTSHSNSTPVASSTRRVASVSSGRCRRRGSRSRGAPSDARFYVRSGVSPAETCRASARAIRASVWACERLPSRARRRHRLRDGDRRARQGGIGAPLPGRRHRGARRPLPVREGLGPARRRELRAGHAARRADRAAGPERLGDGRPAGRPGDARPEVGPEAARRHRARAGARRSGAALGRGAVDRRAGGARRRADRARSRRSSRARTRRRSS